jgi:hypothetical protein
MDISRECMCKDNNPECVECWYNLPGYSVTETKKRLPLTPDEAIAKVANEWTPIQKERTHLTYDEEFAALEAKMAYEALAASVHNSYDAAFDRTVGLQDDPDDGGICYEVVGPRADSVMFSARSNGPVPEKSQLDISSNEHPECLDQNCESCYQRDLRENSGSKPWTAFEEDLADIFDECRNLMVAKHSDYGPDSINSAPGGPLNGLRVRLHDKLARINHLIDTGVGPQNESLRDSFVDLANYAVIGLMVIDQAWPGMENK